MTHKIQIWDREQSLKGLDKDIWFGAYPQAKEKTLVLIDEVQVVFLDDLKSKGFVGTTDTEIVEAYLKKEDEDRKLAEEKAKEEEAKKKTLEDQVKELTEKLENTSNAMQELMLTMMN